MAYYLTAPTVILAFTWKSTVFHHKHLKMSLHTRHNSVFNSLGWEEGKKNLLLLSLKGTMEQTNCQQWDSDRKQTFMLFCK